MGAQERLDKDRSYENSVDNTNVGNQEMLDKDYYENSHDKDSAGPKSRVNYRCSPFHPLIAVML